MSDLNQAAQGPGSERIFRLLVQGVVDYAIFMLDPNGLVISWNAGAERIKGYDASEIVGKYFGIFYTPEDRDAGMPQRSLGSALRDGKFLAEGWRVRKDGSRFFASVVIDAIYEDGALIGFAKITRDISERKSAELALADSENNFRLLVSGVTDYALYMLDPTGIVTNWNSGGQKIKGYLPNEIIGQHFSRFYSEADQKRGRPARALALAKDTGRYEEEGWRVRKDGSLFWASIVIDRIADDSGKLIGFAKITRDISERRAAQEKLEKVQRQLAESQKLDALGQLTGGVAHDFNNLLMIFTGSAQILAKIAEGDPKAKRAVHAIEAAAKRGATLTNQLLSFARRQRVNPETIDVGEQIRSVREVLDTGLGASFELHVQAEPNVWPVTVDIGEFETALVNLIINARDAMPKGGRVIVNAKNVVASKESELGDHVAITVQDNGIGIAPDVLSKIFDPFFTTKPLGKGTGLGLSQVHGFAHQAGGSVAVSSELGSGTAITICLPRGTPEAASVPVYESSAGTGTVLLVDDNPDVAEASAGLLEQLGYVVRLASSAEEALHEIGKDGIDLVLSDIVMPGDMDGLMLAHAIRRRRPSLPILLSTGYSEAAQKVRSEFPILRKPFQLGELGKALLDVARTHGR
jgi:PAS domain S-box-containing protein